MPTLTRPRGFFTWSRQARQTLPAALLKLMTPPPARLDGNAPSDIRCVIHALYRRILAQGALGFGETQMDGLWPSDCLDSSFERPPRVAVEE